MIELVLVVLFPIGVSIIISRWLTENASMYAKGWYTVLSIPVVIVVLFSAFVNLPPRPSEHTVGELRAIFLTLMIGPPLGMLMGAGIANIVHEYLLTRTKYNFVIPLASSLVFSPYIAILWSLMSQDYNKPRVLNGFYEWPVHLGLFIGLPLSLLLGALLGSVVLKVISKESWSRQLDRIDS